MSISAGLTAVGIVLGLFLTLALLGLWPVVFRRQSGPGVAIGCGLLALGGCLFSMMVLFGLSVAYLSHSSPHRPPSATAPLPAPTRPIPIDVLPENDRIDRQPQDDRAADGRAGSQSGGRPEQPRASLLPSPADQPPAVSQGAPTPTQSGPEQQNQSATSPGASAKPETHDSGTQAASAAVESGVVSQSGGTGKSESKALGDDANAESADLISRAMAKGLKAALDFLARERELEKNDARQASEPATPSNQPAIAPEKQPEQASSASAGASTAAAASEGKTPPVSSSAPPAARGESKPASSRQRPAWVDAPLDRISDGHRMSLKVGPCFSADECRRILPEELDKAANQYARQFLNLNFPAGTGIDPERLRSTLVRETWEETVETSVGPTVWLHALVEFDRRAGAVIKEAHRRTVIEQRLKAAGAILGCTLLLLGVVYTGLRADERLAGRFRWLTVAGCLLAAGAVGAGAVGFLRQIAHGG